MTDLPTLLERVKAASGPDRELDADIHLVFQSPSASTEAGRWRKPILLEREHQRPGILEYVKISGVSARPAPTFTASLDAVIAMAERVLPGMHWRIEKTCEYPGLAFRAHKYTGWCGDYGSPKREEGATPALALLAATIQAVIAETEKEGA